MTDATHTPPTTPTTKVPWHFWAVGALAVLWNGYGAYDYLMTQTGGEAYLRDFGMTEPQIAYFAAMPAWTIAVWALGVWGAAIGSVLLLLRSKWAFHLFVVSLAGLLLSLVYSYGLSNGGAVMGTQGAIMSAVILAGCIFFVWYAWTMTKHGVLR